MGFFKTASDGFLYFEFLRNHFQIQ